MPAFTPNLNLYLPGGGSAGSITPDEVVDIDRINQNMRLIDTFAGTVTPTLFDTGWQPITIGTNWVATSGGYSPRVRRLGKQVFLFGSVDYAANASYANMGKVGNDFLPFVNGALDVYVGTAVATEQTAGTAAFGSLAVKPDGTLMFMPNYATKISNNLKNVMMNGVWTVN